MNSFYSASAIQVPTKKDSAGIDRASMPSSGQNGTSAIRRNSSSSSLDVAATIFSSMQELEATGRNLDSLGSQFALHNQQQQAQAAAAAAAAANHRGGRSPYQDYSAGATRALDSFSGMDHRMGTYMGGMGMGSSLNGMMGLGGGPGADSLSASATAATRERLNAIRDRSYMNTRTNSSDSLNMMENMHSMLTGSGITDGPMMNGGSSAYSASIQAQAQALRRLEMEEMMLQQQQQQHQHHYFEGGNNQGINGMQSTSQRATLLGNLKGGYAPMQSSSRHQHGGGGGGSSAPRRGSGSVLDDFTPEELLREVERREQQRRNSREALTGFNIVDAAQQQRRPSSVSLVDALSRNNSRDDLVGLYNQMRQRGGGGGGNTTPAGGGGSGMKVRQNSLDSLDTLALMASNGGNQNAEGGGGNTLPIQGDKDVVGPRTVTDESNMGDNTTPSQKKNKKRNKKGGKVQDSADVVVIVPTAKPESRMMGKRNPNDTPASSDATNSTVVTDTQSPRPEKAAIGKDEGGGEKKEQEQGSSPGEKLRKKRNNSTASFDALLSVFGDELAELDREKNGTSVDGRGEDDDKSAASNASIGFFNQLVEKTAAATAAARQKEAESKDNAGKDQRRFSYGSSLSDEGKNESLLPNQRVGANKDRIISQMDALVDRGMNDPTKRATPLSLRGETSFFPTFPNSGSRPSSADYTHRIHSSASMMASLEALRQEELAMKERMLRENLLRMEQLQAQKRALGGMGPLSGGSIPPSMMAQYSAMQGGADPELEQRLAALFGGRIPGIPDGPLQPPSHHHQAMLARLRGFPPGSMHHEGLLLPDHPTHPMLHPQDPLSGPPPAGTKRHIAPTEQKLRPDVALDIFLKEFGKPAEEARSRMLDAISETEKSLATIHAWDRSQGLRKCHSRTVVKTRRSRARLKAFLNGEEPPKEPTKKRRKTSKKGVAKVEVVDDDIDQVPV